MAQENDPGAAPPPVAPAQARTVSSREPVANRAPSTPTVCVIGAGSAGLASLKALQDAGTTASCFEMGTQVGGLWAINNKNGRAGAYDSLHINTSTTQMQFSDFPMRDDIGDFPAHQHIAAYFRAYAEKFNLLRSIEFQKEVVRCVPSADGYLVTVRERCSGETETRHFESIIVANGHHWSPAFPRRAIFSAFTGRTMHASEYVAPGKPHDFRKERVLVVGMGNSAMDIACELSTENNASSVTVSARRGAWVLPKYIRGKPLDQGQVVPTWLPGKFRRRLVTALFRALYGKMSDYGLPEPDHLIGEAHPTVSDHFPERVLKGAIQMAPAIAECAGNSVRFADGSTRTFETIIFCTGYKVEFPFFDVEHISAPENRLSLYHRAFHLDHRRVFFVGLAQTLGAIMPVAEAQARAIAEHLCGRYNLPSRAQMVAAVDAEEKAMKKRFVSSRRHSMQVIPETFQRLLSKDLRAGKKRAQKGEGIAYPSGPQAP